MKLKRFENFIINEDSWKDGDINNINMKNTFNIKRNDWNSDLILINNEKELLLNTTSNIQVEDIKFINKLVNPNYILYTVQFNIEFANLLNNYIEIYKNLISKYCKDNDTKFIYTKKIKLVMFNEEYNFPKSYINGIHTEIIELQFKIAINPKNINMMDFIIDQNYLPAFLQSKGLGTLIVLAAIKEFNYITLTKEPENHKASSIIETVSKHSDIYMCEYDKFYLVVSKDYTYVKNLITELNKANTLKVLDPELIDII